jgi:hypothetical protein
MCNVECDEFFVTNFTVFFISKFWTDLLPANHLIIWERTKFHNEQKSSKILLEIMTLVININWLECDSKWSRKQVSRFKKNLLPRSAGKQQIPLKCWFLSSKLHGIIPQRALFLFFLYFVINSASNHSGYLLDFFFIEAIPLCDNISILYIPVLHNNLH